MSDEQQQVDLRDVRCTCGEKLVDAVAPPEVVVGDDAIPFRRSTDFLVCPECRSMYRVTDIGSDLVVGGALVAEDPAGPTTG